MYLLDNPDITDIEFTGVGFLADLALRLTSRRRRIGAQGVAPGEIPAPCCCVQPPNGTAQPRHGLPCRDPMTAYRLTG